MKSTTNKLLKNIQLLEEQQLILDAKLRKINIQLEHETHKKNIEYFKNTKGRYFKMIKHGDYIVEKYRFISDFCENSLNITGITLLKENDMTHNIMAFSHVKYTTYEDLKENFIETTKKEFDKKYNQYLSCVENIRLVSRDVIVEKTTT